MALPRIYNTPPVPQMDPNVASTLFIPVRESDGMGVMEEKSGVPGIVVACVVSEEGPPLPPPRIIESVGTDDSDRDTMVFRLETTVNASDMTTESPKRRDSKRRTHCFITNAFRSRPRKTQNAGNENSDEQ
jgi:hypothetical protein